MKDKSKKEMLLKGKVIPHMQEILCWSHNTHIESESVIRAVLLLVLMLLIGLYY